MIEKINKSFLIDRKRTYGEPSTPLKASSHLDTHVLLHYYGLLLLPYWSSRLYTDTIGIMKDLSVFSMNNLITMNPISGLSKLVSADYSNEPILNQLRCDSTDTISTPLLTDYSSIIDIHDVKIEAAAREDEIKTQLKIQVGADLTSVLSEDMAHHINIVDTRIKVLRGDIVITPMKNPVKNNIPPQAKVHEENVTEIEKETADIDKLTTIQLRRSEELTLISEKNINNTLQEERKEDSKLELELVGAIGSFNALLTSRLLAYHNEITHSSSISDDVAIQKAQKIDRLLAKLPIEDIKKEIHSSIAGNTHKEHLKAAKADAKEFDLLSLLKIVPPEHHHEFNKFVKDTLLQEMSIHKSSSNLDEAFYYGKSSEEELAKDFFSQKSNGLKETIKNLKEVVKYQSAIQDKLKAKSLEIKKNSSTETFLESKKYVEGFLESSQLTEEEVKQTEELLEKFNELENLVKLGDIIEQGNREQAKAEKARAKAEKLALENKLDISKSVVCLAENYKIFTRFANDLSSKITGKGLISENSAKHIAIGAHVVGNGAYALLTGDLLIPTVTTGMFVLRENTDVLNGKGNVFAQATYDIVYATSVDIITLNLPGVVIGSSIVAAKYGMSAVLGEKHPAINLFDVALGVKDLFNPFNVVKAAGILKMGYAGYGLTHNDVSSSHIDADHLHADVGQSYWLGGFW